MMPGRKILLAALLGLGVLFFGLLGYQQLKGGEARSLTAQLLSFGRRQPDAIVNLDARSVADWSAISPAIQPKIDFCDFSADQKPAGKSLIINEVAWMGTVEDSLAEWIELKNISDKILALSGYQLIDQAGQIKISLPAVNLPAGGFFLLVRENDSSRLTASADLIYKGALGNTDEALKLFDKQCRLVDEAAAKPKWPAGDNQTKQTMERTKDLIWQNSLLASGTPKKENSFYPSVASSSVVIKEEIKQEEIKIETVVQPEIKKEEPPVRANPEPVVQNNNAEEQIPPPSEQNQTARIIINEILFDAAGGESGKKDEGREFIELYNPTETPTDLRGWSLKYLKENSTSSFPLASFIGVNDRTLTPARGFLLVGLYNYEAVNYGGRTADIRRSASLPNGADQDKQPLRITVVLFNNEGSEIDSIVYDKNSITAEGQSLERQNGGEFFIQASPNPQNSQGF